MAERHFENKRKHRGGVDHICKDCSINRMLTKIEEWRSVKGKEALRERCIGFLVRALRLGLSGGTAEVDYNEFWRVRNNKIQRQSIARHSKRQTLQEEAGLPKQLEYAFHNGAQTLVDAIRQLEAAKEMAKNDLRQIEAAKGEEQRQLNELRKAKRSERCTLEQNLKNELKKLSRENEMHRRKNSELEFQVTAMRNELKQFAMTLNSRVSEGDQMSGKKKKKNKK